MKFKSLIAAAAISSSLIGVTTVAHAAATVTFSPTATNGGAGAIGTVGDFSAVGFQSNLASTLVISGNSGTVSYSETGLITITSFRDASNSEVTSGVNSDYTLKAAFTLTGTGTWSGSTFAANPLTTAFGVDIWANGVTTGDLIGTAALDPTRPQVAFAIAFGSVAPGASGSALTSLTASLAFTPTAGYEGAGGFFQTTPLNLVLAVGNAGGNTQNTGYTVDAAGNVSFILPVGTANEGTANVTFERQTVPEPGMLSLAGIALVGAAIAGRRRKVPVSI